MFDNTILKILMDRYGHIEDIGQLEAAIINFLVNRVLPIAHCPSFPPSPCDLVLLHLVQDKFTRWRRTRSPIVPAFHCSNIPIVPARHRSRSGEFPILRNSGVRIPDFGIRKPELGSGRERSELSSSIGNPIFKPIKTGPKHVMVIFVPLTLGTLGTLTLGT